MPPETRLNKYLALQLGISRRAADELIAGGAVEVNGQPATLGSRFRAGDRVTVNKKPLQQSPAELKYVLMNKPPGYVCSRRRQGSAPTIYELLPPELRALKPAGRLDRNSSGLLLLTNDGDFAYRMTHPKFHKTKVYEVSLDRDLEPAHQQMISGAGVKLDDGVSRLGLARLKTSRRDWQVTMSEGRNRQIRRTFAALGYHVTRLHRVQFGPYALGDIKPGDYKSTNMR